MAGNRSIANVVFHQNAIIPADGITYMVTSDASTMNLDFIGSGSFISVVEGKVSNEGTFDEIMVVDLSNLDMTTTPNTFHTYQCDITAWGYIRVRLTSVSGEVSCIARLVG